MIAGRRAAGAAAGLLALILVMTVEIALAQGNVAATIAVIDPQFLLYNSNAARNARAQSERIREQYQQEFKRRQDEIDKLYETLVSERATLAPDAYQRRAQDLQQKAAVYQREAQERQARLDGALNGASQRIATAMTQVVDEIVKEQRLTLVVPRSIAVGTPNAPDITQDVLTRLNQKLPTVTLELPR